MTRVRSYPGAAGTVINNLAALGVGRIYPIAFIGDDGEGYELRQALKLLPAVEQGGIISVPDRRTPTYTKPMLGKEELNRLDIKNRTPTPDGRARNASSNCSTRRGRRLDALIVLDQVSEADCGVVTKRVRDHLAELGERDPDKFVLADSRERIGLFRNVCVKPNRGRMRHGSPRTAFRGRSRAAPRRIARTVWPSIEASGLLHDRARAGSSSLGSDDDPSRSHHASPPIPSPVRSTSSGRGTVARPGSRRRWCPG